MQSTIRPAVRCIALAAAVLLATGVLPQASAEVQTVRIEWRPSTVQSHNRAASVLLRSTNRATDLLVATSVNKGPWRAARDNNGRRIVAHYGTTRVGLPAMRPGQHYNVRLRAEGADVQDFSQLFHVQRLGITSYDRGVNRPAPAGSKKRFFASLTAVNVRGDIIALSRTSLRLQSGERLVHGTDQLGPTEGLAEFSPARVHPRTAKIDLAHPSWTSLFVFDTSSHSSEWDLRVGEEG